MRLHILPALFLAFLLGVPGAIESAQVTPSSRLTLLINGQGLVTVEADLPVQPAKANQPSSTSILQGNKFLLMLVVLPLQYQGEWKVVSAPDIKISRLSSGP